MNNPAVDIAEILEQGIAEGSSSTNANFIFATNMFINKEPSTPINCITIFDGYGSSPDFGLTSKGYERPSIQIRVRNKKQADAWTLINEIKDTLHGLGQTTVNGTLYTVIYCTSGPALLDWDDNGNCRLVINFNLQRRSV